MSAADRFLPANECECPAWQQSVIGEMGARKRALAIRAADRGPCTNTCERSPSHGGSVGETSPTARTPGCAAIAWRKRSYIAGSAVLSANIRGIERYGKASNAVTIEAEIGATQPIE